MRGEREERRDEWREEWREEKGGEGISLLRVATTEVVQFSPLRATPS